MTAIMQPGVQARTWTLEMPPAVDVLTANDRGTWKKSFDYIRELRGQAATIARAAKMPPIPRARIAYVWEPPDNRHMDAGNLYPHAKAYIDGLVKPGGFLPDDDSWHVIGPDPRMGWPRQLVGRMTLIVTELPPLLTFGCTSAKAAEAVVEYARKTSPDVEHRARVQTKTKTVTVMYTDPDWSHDLASWAITSGHTYPL